MSRLIKIIYETTESSTRPAIEAEDTKRELLETFYNQVLQIMNETPKIKSSVSYKLTEGGNIDSLGGQVSKKNLNETRNYTYTIEIEIPIANFSNIAASDKATDELNELINKYMNTRSPEHSVDQECDITLRSTPSSYEQEMEKKGINWIEIKYSSSKKIAHSEYNIPHKSQFWNEIRVMRRLQERVEKELSKFYGPASNSYPYRKISNTLPDNAAEDAHTFNDGKIDFDSCIELKTKEIKRPFLENVENTALQKPDLDKLESHYELIIKIKGLPWSANDNLPSNLLRKSLIKIAEDRRDSHPQDKCALTLHYWGFFEEELVKSE
ncbi:MAG: hypothetical protein ACP5N3_04840 [Candidatus Nanoarchaeia archaeon]